MVGDMLSASKLCNKLRKRGLRVSYITGCFDIVHIGHIELFQFAKSKSDFLIVGVDNDESIRLSKGENRPVNHLTKRMEYLNELKSVDYIFPIDGVCRFDGEDAITLHAEMLKEINPTFLVTRKSSDKYWKRKKNICTQLNIAFISLKATSGESSSLILSKLRGEI